MTTSREGWGWRAAALTAMLAGSGAAADAQDCMGVVGGPGSVAVGGSLRYPSDEAPFSALPQAGATLAYRPNGRVTLLAEAHSPVSDTEVRKDRPGVEIGAALGPASGRRVVVCPKLAAGFESHWTEASRLTYGTIGIGLGTRLEYANDSWMSLFAIPSLIVRHATDDGDEVTSVRPFADLGAAVPLGAGFNAAVLVRRAFLDGERSTIGIQLGRVFD